MIWVKIPPVTLRGSCPFILFSEEEQLRTGLSSAIRLSCSLLFRGKMTQVILVFPSLRAVLECLADVAGDGPEDRLGLHTCF